MFANVKSLIEISKIIQPTTTFDAEYIPTIFSNEAKILFNEIDGLTVN